MAKVIIPRELLKKSFLPPLISQLAVSLLTARVHSGNRTGSLYLLRVFDFLTTITALKFSPRFLGPGARNRASWSLMLPLAISASLSWLEFGHIEYDGFGLFLAPILAIAKGINILVLKRSFQDFRSEISQGSFELFSLYHTGMVTVALAFPAITSYLQSTVSYDASWESIDYILMSMSVIFMVCFKFSELCLTIQTELPVYCTLEHSKFFFASIGQWWLQNMAHASIYAFIGKVVFFASSLRFWQNVDLMPKRQIN